MEPVLAVPVAAVYSRPDGITFVTVEGKGHSLCDVEVDAGKVAGGRVQVTPQRAGFEAGASIVVGHSADTPPLDSKADGPLDSKADGPLDSKADGPLDSKADGR